MKFSPILAFAVLVLVASCSSSKKMTSKSKDEALAAYLMVYFKDDDHSLHMALSSDGYTFTDINQGNAVIGGDTIAVQKGIRDPHIYRGPDGTFYLAMTDLHIFAQRDGYRDTEWDRDGAKFGWGNNRGFVLMKSEDLINWSIANVDVSKAFPGYEEIGCAWAPETIYDEDENKLMVYFTMRFGNGLNKLYYSYVNDEFDKLLTEPKLLFEYPKDITYIDADISKFGETYQMFYTPHDGYPGIKKAVSDKVNEGYVYDDRWFDTEPKHCEAPNVWKRIGEEKWVLMYDVYSIHPHNFAFRETSDFEAFTDLGRLNEGVMKSTNFSSPKHGAVIHLTKSEAQKLAAHWGMTFQ